MSIILKDRTKQGEIQLSDIARNQASIRCLSRCAIKQIGKKKYIYM